MFIGRTDAEAETLILWPPDAKTDSFEKTLMWERLNAGGEGDTVRISLQESLEDRGDVS